MLAELLVAPGSREEWNVWSQHHRENHDAIRRATEAQRSTNLNEYPLDPIPLDLARWLEWNQRAHNEMNAANGLQGSDLGELKPDDQATLKAWIFAHYQEHLTANMALKI